MPNPETLSPRHDPLCNLLTMDRQCDCGLDTLRDERKNVDALVELLRVVRAERGHALDDLKAEIANHREDVSKLEAFSAGAVQLGSQRTTERDAFREAVRMTFLKMCPNDFGEPDIEGAKAIMFHVLTSWPVNPPSTPSIP